MDTAVEQQGVVGWASWFSTDRGRHGRCPGLREGFADGGKCGYVMIMTHDGKPVQEKEEGKEGAGEC